MTTIATMGMRSILFFAAILGFGGAFAATNDALNATNSAVSSTASVESARSLLADAVRNLTNSPAKATPTVTRTAGPKAAATTTVAEAKTDATTTNVVAAIPQAPIKYDELDSKIHLHAGDMIRFRVQEDKEDTKRLNITDGGEVEIPYLGYVKAEGKTCKELAMDVKRALEDKYYYLATVNIAVESVFKKSLGRVYIYGKGVANPGPQDIPQDEPWTVGKAVLRAGPTEFADLKSVKLIKKGGALSTDKPEGAASLEKDKKEQAILVDVRDITRNGRTEKDVPVEPQDLIVVGTVVVHFGN